MNAVSPLFGTGAAAKAGAASNAQAAATATRLADGEPKRQRKFIVEVPDVSGLSECIGPFEAQCLKRDVVGFTCANAHGVLDRRHKDLAVTDLTGLGSPCDGLDRFVDVP